MPPQDAGLPIRAGLAFTTVELRDLLAKNEAVVIDVRNEPSWAAGHIRGAKLIPFADVVKHANELPKDKLIVTYCS